MSDDDKRTFDPLAGSQNESLISSFLNKVEENEEDWIPLENQPEFETENTTENQKQADSQDNSKEKPSSDNSSPWNALSSMVTKLVSSSDENSVDTVLEKARTFVSSENFHETKSEKDLETLRQEFNRVLDQLKGSFGHLGLDQVSPLSFLYLLEREESIKTPSWKRRKHRYLESPDYDTAHAGHDALYLAELAYVDSVEEIKAGLEAYADNPYEMIYCTVESSPREPAHFVALKKQSTLKQKRKGFSWPWQREERCLEVLIVVRGTKEVGDMLSDALLQASDYRGGRAHNGILESGRFIVTKHMELLEHLLKESMYDKIQITLIGHSLGAGTASIAAMEFNDHPKMSAICVGFGCPALLNKDLSLSTVDYITTVVSDCDMVPRMSGATVANVLIDAKALDWIDSGVADVNELLMVSKSKVPFLLSDDKIDELTEWARAEIRKSIDNNRASLPEEREKVELFPPGKCIHLYRDGVGISANYVPCDFFDGIDVSRTMIEDHYITEGYHKLLVELMRNHTNDSTFSFRHDLAALRSEKEQRLAKLEQDKSENGEETKKEE